MRWIEPTRRKSSEKHFWTRITDRNNGIRSLVRSVKKMQNLQTVIIWARSANLLFENGFLMEIKRFLHPFVPEISQLTGKLIPSKKEEKEHHWRRI
jgi:hypothetical protein